MRNNTNTFKHLLAAAITIAALAAGHVTAEAQVTISTAEEWNTFASNVNSGTTYSGQTIVLAADITITTGAGSSSTNSFGGTFEGGGHTLTLNLTHSSGGDAWIAPFRYINGATIKHLHTAGTISTNGKMAGGIVGDSWGTSTIQSCRSSVTISSSISGDGTHGGLVGRVNDGTLTINDCLFDGSITGAGTNSCGGFVGWKEASLVLNRCLQAGDLSGISSSGGSTFSRFNSGSVDFSTCYYRTAYGTTQGTQTAATGSTLQGLLGAAWEVSGNDVLPIMDVMNLTTATISGISRYYMYSGSAINIEYDVTDASGSPLTKGTHYTETISPSATVLEKGDYTLTITGTYPYYGTREYHLSVLDGIPYVDAAGVEHTMQATPLDNTMTTLAAGWYVVNSDVTFTQTVTTTGDVTLILGDDCTMSFGTEVDLLDGKIIECNSHDLTIYGQSGGTGWLKAYSAQNNGIHVNNYTQYSGNVVICVVNGACIYANNSVALLGGTLDLKSEGEVNGEITGGSISILGGKLWARNKGLWSPQGITLGYTNATDQIYVKIYHADGMGLKIADGKTLVNDNGEIWSGALHNIQIEHGINDRTLKPLVYSGVTLTKDGSGNVSATFSGSSETTVSIPVDVNVNSVTYDRAFTEGRPATVMLPFSLSSGQTLTGGTLYKFSGVTKNETAGKWEATMTETATLQANTPYLLLPDENLVDGKVTFNLGSSWSTVTLNTTGGGNGVTADEGSHWTFKGTYEHMKWTTNTEDDDYNADREAEIGRAYGFAGVAKTDIEVGDFVRVANGAKIRPMGCYLLWNNEPNSANARSFTRGAAATDEELPQRITVRLVGSNGEVTGIGTLDTKTGEMTFDSEAWYTLDGVRLSGKPSSKGIYINNGKKIVIK